MENVFNTKYYIHLLLNVIISADILVPNVQIKFSYNVKFEYIRFYVVTHLKC